MLTAQILQGKYYFSFGRIKMLLQIIMTILFKVRKVMMMKTMMVFNRNLPPPQQKRRRRMKAVMMNLCLLESKYFLMNQFYLFIIVMLLQECLSIWGDWPTAFGSHYSCTYLCVEICYCMTEVK